MSRQSSYLKLKEIFQEISAFDSAMAILRWDAETYMQAGGRESRALELSTLSKHKKKILTSLDMAKLVDKALEEELEAEDKLNLLEMHIIVKEARILPEKLNQQIIHAISKSEAAWLEAREANDYKLFLPSFKTMLDLSRHKAEIKSEAFGLSFYDALIYEHDKYLKEEDLDPLCSSLEIKLPALIKRKTSQTKLQFSLQAKAREQKRFIKKLLKKLKFDYRYGRFDETLHPFCEGHSEDIRVAVNFDEENYLNTIMATMHEFGHALYDTNLPVEWIRQPLGKDAGMIVHEAQALLFEMMIARSESFFDLITPLMQEYLGLDKKHEAKILSQELRRTSPELIRIEADYLTYPAHIIMRYKIEQGLIYGDIAAEDLPDAFDHYMQKLLGIKPTNLSNGVLQDIHWASGYFGYFPCYLIGAVLASLLHTNLKKEFPDFNKMITEADLRPIYNWLTNNLYRHGRKINSKKLLYGLKDSKLDIASQYLKILEDY